MKKIYRFEFDAGNKIEDIEDTVTLSIIAVGCVFGDARTRLEFGGYTTGPSKATGNPTVVIDATSEVGMLVATVFTGFCSKEYGEKSFRVMRVTTPLGTDEETPCKTT